MQKFTAAGPVSVVLDVPAGSIRVIASDRGDATVDVRPADASKKRDLKAAKQTLISHEDGVLRISTPDGHRVLGGAGSLDVTIEVPTGSRFEGQAGAADLHASGRLGDVAFDGGYRAVAIAEAADVRLSVHTGAVTVSRVTGSARISNGMGDITIGEVGAGTVEVRTGSGNLSVGAADGVSAALDARTGRGRIVNALLNAEGAAAPLRITATTEDGDITAHSV